MNVLEFKSMKDAQACLSIINENLFGGLRTEGYDVVERQRISTIMGRNVATGMTAAANAGTERWAIVQENPDGTFFFASPSGDKRVSHVLAKCNGIEFREMSCPEHWVNTEGIPTGLAATLRIFSKRLLGVFQG